ncbi:AraC family transcriptional regulator [Schlesneria paludicola]|uniref:AraC family transcriptional regulator n=1 Tax=Schlesneria paludicola TaxID=360056 RepID=UPI00029B044B|nr:AraC family transcriptional regulator [Schlesneria paludicola]
MDVLTDLLNIMGTSAHVDELARAEAGWRSEIRTADHLTCYAVAGGECRLKWGSKSISLGRGELVIVNQGVSHRIQASKIGQTVLVSGRIQFLSGTSGHTILELPSLLRLTASAESTTLGLFEHLIREVTLARPGWESVTAGLVIALFVEALRVHGASVEDGSRGWLRGLSDADVAAALQLMHQQPSHRWTVAELAQRLSISRSAFAARFKTVTGRPPLEYLTWWRLYRAAARLRRRDGSTVAQIARDAGYDSDVSFGKAFRREFGRTPGALRREGSSRTRSPLQLELKKRLPFDFPEQETGLNLFKTAAFFQGDYEALFTRHGIRSTWYNVLRILRGVGTPVELDEVAVRLVVPHARPLELFEEIASANYLEFVNERRALAITQRGLDTLAGIDGTLIDIHRRQLGHLSPGELAELDRLLVKARRRDGS